MDSETTTRRLAPFECALGQRGASSESGNESHCPTIFNLSQTANVTPPEFAIGTDQLPGMTPVFRYDDGQYFSTGH